MAYQQVSLAQKENGTVINVLIAGRIPHSWSVICDPKCRVNQLQRRASGCSEFVDRSPAGPVDSRPPDDAGLHRIQGEIGCTDDPDGPTPLAAGQPLNVGVSIESFPQKRGVLYISR